MPLLESFCAPPLPSAARSTLTDRLPLRLHPLCACIRPGTGKFLLTVDLHGLGFRDLNPGTAATCVPAILSHYPGQIGAVAILDAPFIFKAAWAAIASMLDAATAEKVQMLRGDAMDAYFRAHLTEAQAGFMHEVLRMKSAPGSLPEATADLRQPLDSRSRSAISMEPCPIRHIYPLCIEPQTPQK